jgi:lysozyme
MSLTPEMMSKLKKSLVLHEDYKKFPYVDIVGKVTIGIGYNLTDRGIDEEWINNQYLKDVNYFYDQLCNFFWFKNLNMNRQIALIDMAFMGWKRFLEFKSMINALELGDFKKAAYEMINSEWASQVKSRAVTLSHVMLTGEYHL